MSVDRMGHRLQEAFGRQKRAFDSGGGLSLEERRRELRKLRKLIKGRARDFARTIAEDFGGRSRHETLLAEIAVLVGAVDHSLSNLARWARPERVALGWRFWPACARIEKQPLGVAGILAPWNYPVQLALLPAVGALSAGCRVLVKPSELAPATSEMLARTIADEFAPEIFAAVSGGPDVAAEMTALPFDALVFTGSGRIGRQVLAAAAENLVPVVLELGGKSPAIVDETADIQEAAAAIIAGKLLNAGQTCVAPDYVLVPRRLRAEFITSCLSSAKRFYPDPAGEDYSAIRGVEARERLLTLQNGLESVPMFDIDLEAPKLTPRLLLDPPDQSPVMREEIFGPLLPVISYDDADDVVGIVNSRARALALYWFGRDAGRLRSILDRTLSGAVAVNDTVIHAAVESLPFGGVGGSGFGAYHGIAGFSSFTHRRPVLVQGFWAGSRLARPPYGAITDRIVDFLTR